MSSVKSLVENFALVASALCISEQSKEATVEVLYSKVAELYVDKLAYWTSHGDHSPTLKPFLNSMSPVELQGLGGKLAGEALWKKWQLLRRQMMNEAGPRWSVICKEDPTGKSFAERLLMVRRQLWDMESAAKKLTVAAVFKDTWYPPYWAAWVHFGPPAGAGASAILSANMSSGPKKNPISPIMSADAQRAILDKPTPPLGPLSRQELRDQESNKRRKGNNGVGASAEGSSVVLVSLLARSNDIELYQSQLNARSNRSKELKSLVDYFPDNAEHMANYMNHLAQPVPVLPPIVADVVMPTAL